MSQLPILIRREFWENRNVFLILPLAIVGFTLLMYLLVGVASSPENVTIEIDIEGDSKLVEDIMRVDNAYEFGIVKLAELSALEREQGMRIALLSVTGTLFFVAWLVTFFYLLNSLYADRKDRSVLFWKSMPVSDAMTVLSKLITGAFAVPLVYLAGAIVLQLVGLLVMTFVAMGAGVSPWEVLWQPANYPALVLQMLLAILFLALWHLPLFGWLLSVSAFARSVPFVWAIGVPIALVIGERILTRQSHLGVWLGQHTVPSRLVEDGGSMIDNITTHAFSMEMVSAVVVGAALVVIAIWLRGKADEI